MEIRRGAVAKCSVGRIGLITSDQPEKMVFFNGDEAMVWKGVQLTNGLGGKNKDYPQKVGDFWCSKNPEVLFYIEDMLNTHLECLEAANPKQLG